MLLVVILLIGTSLAIFQNYARQSGTNNLGATTCFSVTFEGVNSAINLANDYPIPDSEGLERTPYTFKVTNNCDQFQNLSIGVETLSTSEIPSNLIKGVIVNNRKTPSDAMLLSNGKTMEPQNGGTAYELFTDTLPANSSKTYDLRLWFDESMTKEQGASKKYQGKVIIGSSIGIAPTYKLTIHYLYEDNAELWKPYVGYFKEGESFSIASPILDGFRANYESIISPATGMPSRDIEVNVIYTQIVYYTLTVHYVDGSNGNKLASDYVAKLEAGQTFKIASPSIDGYIPDFAQITSPATGMPASDVTIVVAYYQNGTDITVDS